MRLPDNMIIRIMIILAGCIIIIPGIVFLFIALIIGEFLNIHYNDLIKNKKTSHF